MLDDTTDTNMSISENPPQNGVNIDDVPKKSKRKSRARPKKALGEATPETPPKPKLATLQEIVVESLNRTSLRTLKEEPDVNLALFEPSKGVQHFVELQEDGVCEIVPMSYVTKVIALFVKKVARSIPEYRWEAKEIKGCAALWAMHTPSIEPPAPVRFKSDPGLCLHRLPFDIAPGASPVFDEMMKRMNNAEAVMAWTASLFIEDSYMQQYLWNYGIGNDSKSSLAEWLRWLMGMDKAVTIQYEIPRLSNKHWAMPLLNKRLVIYPDFDDYKSMSSGLVRALTSGAPVLADPKGKEAFTAQLTCKHLFVSNQRPNLSSLKADKRRIILTRHATTEAFNPKYLDALKAESGAFLAKCFDVYYRLCPNHGPIPISDESQEDLDNWVSTIEQEYEVFFEKNFRCSSTRHVLAADLEERMANNWTRRSSKLSFVSWLERTHNIRKSRERVEGSPNPKMLYRGICTAPLSYQ